ncbi:MAG: hypothetical protein J1E56_07060 [Ruminococcus sp.]|nr:hypothetical protein [Ruminococcus sp.]
MSAKENEFICLIKEWIHTITLRPLTPNKPYVITSSPEPYVNEQLESYSDSEIDYIYKIFNLLRLFKDGNIGFKEIFIKHSYSAYGLIDQNFNIKSVNENRNLADIKIFSLAPNEVSSCNDFLQKYCSKPYDFLKPCIDKFMWGMDLDTSTGFEQFASTLEMLLLNKNEQNKKEKLSKRVAVLLGTDSSNITSLYHKMKSFYKYRSESIHEGITNNINVLVYAELKEIVRSVLKKYLQICYTNLISKSHITWPSIKRSTITYLKNEVDLKSLLFI